MRTWDYSFNQQDGSVYVRHYHQKIDTSQDVIRVLQRSVWQEEKQDDVYKKRCLSYNNLSEFGNEFVDIFRDELETEDLVLEKERNREISKVINGLSKRQKEVVEQCVLGGKQISEYAKEVGIPQSSASLYKKNALKKLKRLLEGGEYEDYYR